MPKNDEPVEDISEDDQKLLDEIKAVKQIDKIAAIGKSIIPQSKN